MSKEMLIIVLGVLVVLTRTVLGIPGSWQTVVLVFTGLAIAVIGFLLRGEAISRSATRPQRPERSSSYSFVENQPTADISSHEHQEKVTG
jgi:hypothetical protein